MGFIQTVTASPETVYQYLTVPALRQGWLCNDCHGTPRVGGYYHFAWNDGYTAHGTYTVLEPHTRIALTWNDGSVEINLKADDDCTLIEVKHDESTAQLWQAALENLNYLLETGLDYRIMSRPMLGVFPAQLTEQHIHDLGLPVTEGVYLNGVLAGLGAEAAGLQTGDVIVSLNGKHVTDSQSLPTAIAGCKAGETVEVVFYRSGEKHTIPMTLSSRPLPQWDTDLKEIVDHMEREEAQVCHELDELIATTDNDEMRQRPASNEWSGNDNLAHLIWTERFQHFGYWGWEQNADFMEWPSNNDIHLAGILAAYPTTDMLVEELKRAMAASRAMVAALPASTPKMFVARLALGQPGMYTHVRGHMQQIQDTLAAVRQASGVTG